MSNAALLAAIGFDTNFPSITKPQTPDVWDLIAEDDAKREAHVAELTPRLARIYAVTPERMESALHDVDLTRNAPLLDALLARDDHAEIGRLLLADIDARLRTQAEDDAEEDGYRVIPERAIR